MLKDTLASLRQLRYPPEFRISRPARPHTVDDALTEAARELHSPGEDDLSHKISEKDKGKKMRLQLAESEAKLAEMQQKFDRYEKEMSRLLSEKQQGAGDERSIRLLADICTVTWRIQKKTSNGNSESAKAFEHEIKDMWNLLLDNKVQIEDHDGKAYSGGDDLRVLAFQPTSEVTREQVLETIKPTIYYNDKKIQRGEVIVGMPEAPLEK